MKYLTDLYIFGVLYKFKSWSFKCMHSNKWNHLYQHVHVGGLRPVFFNFFVVVAFVKDSTEWRADINAQQSHPVTATYIIHKVIN